jgi:hypothetical protein
MPSCHPSWFFSREIVPVARRARRGFCQLWQELVELFEYRGTMPISGREFIPVQSWFKRALARSRYAYSKSVWGAEAKAKTMTSLFTLLTVLSVGFWRLFILTLILLFKSRHQARHRSETEATSGICRCPMVSIFCLI